MLPMKRSDAPAFPTPFPIPHSPTRQWRRQVKRSPQATIRSADSDSGRRVDAEKPTAAGHHGTHRARHPGLRPGAGGRGRKPDFDWYCCAKINRKESEIREQVSKEKVCEGEASSLLGEDSFLGICSPTKLPQSEPGGDSFLGICSPISEPKI